MVFVNGQLNILLIKYFLNDFTSVGFFSRGQRVAMLVVTAGHAIWPLLFSRWASLTSEKLTNHAEKTLRVVSFLSVIIVVGILLTGKWIVLLLYGKEFLPSVMPMMILVPGAGMYLLSRVLMQLLGSRGSPEFSTVALLIGAASNAVLCMLFIPGNGIIGAAWASTTGNIILLIVLMLIVRKKYNLRLTHCLCLNKNDIKSI